MALAASAGGFHALSTVLGALPKDLGAALLIVQHLDPRYPSILASLLDRQASIPVRQAAAGTPLQRGVAYVAPPDRHLGVGAGYQAVLSAVPPLHFVRPSAEVLFDSVATMFGRQGIAVVLSGSGSDGSAGVCRVKEQGGAVVAQLEAEFTGMPTAAIQSGCVDVRAPLEEIPEVLMRLVTERSVS